MDREDWNPDKRVIDFILNQENIGEKTIKAHMGAKEYSLREFADEIKQGTEYGKRMYDVMLGVMHSMKG